MGWVELSWIHHTRLDPDFLWAETFWGERKTQCLPIPSCYFWPWKLFWRTRGEGHSMEDHGSWCWDKRQQSLSQVSTEPQSTFGTEATVLLIEWQLLMQSICNFYSCKSNFLIAHMKKMQKERKEKRSLLDPCPTFRISKQQPRKPFLSLVFPVVLALIMHFSYFTLAA